MVLSCCPTDGICAAAASNTRADADVANVRAVCIGDPARERAGVACPERIPVRRGSPTTNCFPVTGKPMADVAAVPDGPDPEPRRLTERLPARLAALLGAWDEPARVSRRAVSACGDDVVDAAVAASLEIAVDSKLA